jgi:hypothetical protein
MPGVSQISPPVRILLVASIAFLAAWMLFLRPKPESVEPPTAAPNTQTAAPAVTGPGKAAEAAQDAVAKANGTADKAAAKPSTTAAAPATEAANKRVLALEPLTREQTKGLPKQVVKALNERKVLALGVFNTRDKRWAKMPADDRAVRRALDDANRYEGKVAVSSVSLRKLSKLYPVIGDLGVAQSPAVVVVDRNRHATVLTGYVDRVSINQAIADARRNSIEVRVKGAYLRDVNSLCKQYSVRMSRFDVPTSVAGINPAFARLSGVVKTYRGRFGALTAPARYKGLQTSLLAQLGRDQKFADAVGAAFKQKDLAKATQAFASYDLAAAAALDSRLDRAGVTSCVGNRVS